MTRRAALSVLPLLFLAGCLSVSTSEVPAPDGSAACTNRDQLCREICAAAGVQAFTCNAKPGEGFYYRCECRRPGSSI